MPRGAFLFLSHVAYDELFQDAEQIAHATRTLGDTWILFQGEQGTLKQTSSFCRIHYSSDSDVRSLGYPLFAPSLVPGSAQFSLIHFARQHPEYDYYWIIEFDVKFRGNWETFFNTFHSRSDDFLASHMHNFAEEPNWCYWFLEHPTEAIAIEKRIRCFHPIYKFSKRAISFIDQKLLDGWVGHSEGLVPTLLYHNGFSIGDYGGDGPYRIKSVPSFYIGTPPTFIGLLNRGTLRYRPGFRRAGLRWNKIYHPVKPTDKNAQCCFHKKVFTALRKKLFERFL